MATPKIVSPNIVCDVNNGSVHEKFCLILTLMAFMNERRWLCELNVLNVTKTLPRRGFKLQTAYFCWSVCASANKAILPIRFWRRCY